MKRLLCVVSFVFRVALAAVIGLVMTVLTVQALHEAIERIK